MAAIPIKRAFLSRSYRPQTPIDAELARVTETLAVFRIETVDFVARYAFAEGQEQAMMRQACGEIARCDLLVAEVSEKAIGVGIEIGYAAALGKPVIYLRRARAEYSTTVGGLASASIVYTSVDDLGTQLAHALSQLTKAHPSR